LTRKNLTAPAFSKDMRQLAVDDRPGGEVQVFQLPPDLNALD
jgi:hypothetical protein